MEIIDKGVLEGSFMDFSIPSEFARRALFFTESFGHYICNKNYRIERPHLKQFLLVFVCDGALHVKTDEQDYIISENQIGLVDCRKKHAYWCDTSEGKKTVDFFWFHYYGTVADIYTEHLIEQYGLVYSGPNIGMLKENVMDVINSAQNPLTNEHVVSADIHNVLGRLTMTARGEELNSNVITPAIIYIHNHFMEEISSDELAACCGISKSHFIRTFNRYVDCTPHKYLINYRIRQAKRMLLSTDMTVERIAEQCGFNSASHFAREFKHNSMMTPGEFRNTLC